MHKVLLKAIGQRLQDTVKQASTQSFEEIVKHMTIPELRLFALPAETFTPEMEAIWQRAIKLAEEGGRASV